MDDHYQKFDNILKGMDDSVHKTQLLKVMNGFKTCSAKMIQALKFIDFFVHDILDYTLLNKSMKNFTKDIKYFNIKVAVSEIIGIFEDKANFKNINVECIYVDFERDEVRTDAKRF